METEAVDGRTVEDFEALFAWLRASDEKNEVEHVEAYRTRDDGGGGSAPMDLGWGLRATKTLKANERALSVSKSSWLTVEYGLSDGEIGGALREALEDFGTARWTILALTLLKERERGSKAKFAAYVKTLPKRLDSPLFWSAEELGMLNGTQLLDSAAGYDAYLRDAYASLKEGLFAKYSTLFDASPGAAFDEASFRWAFGILRSRCLPPCEGAEIALVPGVDLCNHSTLSTSKWVASGGFAGAVAGLFGQKREGGTMRIDVDRTTQKGEPIWVNYAPDGIDSQFALDFGFVDAVTPSPGYSLTLSIPEDDVNCFDKLDVLEVAGLSESPTFTLRPYSDPDRELRTFLRLLNCQGQDAFLLEALFRQQTWGLISDPLSKENEAACCASVINGCAAALSAYDTRTVDIEKSTLSSPPGSLSHRENVACRVRLAEKSALIETASFFDVVASRLDKLEYYQERRLRSLNLIAEDGSSTYDPFNETMA